MLDGLQAAPKGEQISECCRILSLVDCDDSHLRDTLGQVASFLETYDAEQREERKELERRLLEEQRKVLNLENMLKYFKAEKVRKNTQQTTDQRTATQDDLAHR